MGRVGSTIGGFFIPLTIWHSFTFSLLGHVCPCMYIHGSGVNVGHFILTLIFLSSCLGGWLVGNLTDCSECLQVHDFHVSCFIFPFFAFHYHHGLPPVWTGLVHSI